MAPKETKLIIEDVAAKDSSRMEVNILCLDLTQYSSLAQFLVASGAVFGLYIAYGYYLELIFSAKEVKNVSLYITLIQFLLTTFFSYVESAIRTKIERKAPLKTYFLLAGLTLGTMVFSNLALSYLNYPTQLIFKSCKLIPVMIGSILIQGRRYGFIDYTAAIIMCVGLTMFTLADSKTSPNFDPMGVLIICLALVCDAIIGNVQEKIMKQYQVTNNEVVFYSYSLASFYLFIFTVVSGTFVEGFKYCNQNAVTMYSNIFMLSATGYAGLQAVLTLVRVCGAPATVAVTTMRKALSILFSFLLFSKPFVFQYAWSGMLIVLAIYLNVYSKSRPNYTPQCVLQCFDFLRHIYLSEYRLLKSRSKYYSYSDV